MVFLQVLAMIFIGLFIQYIVHLSPMSQSCLSCSNVMSDFSAWCSSSRLSLLAYMLLLTDKVCHSVLPSVREKTEIKKPPGTPGIQQTAAGYVRYFHFHYPRLTCFVALKRGITPRICMFCIVL